MTKQFNIVKTVNQIGDEVDLVLEKRRKGKYFETIILLYSLIENLLKWALFIKIIWRKSDRVLQEEEVGKLRSFCRKSDFYTALNTALSLDLIDLNLYKNIDKVRKERNDVIHQLWIYENRRNSVVLRKTLERLTRVARQLAKTTSELTDEVGLEEIYKVTLRG